MLDIIKEYINGKRIFINAELSGADLRGADLSDANLRDANLRDADLSGANLPAFQIPGGVIQGWKKLQNRLIAELTIPWEAKRTASLIGRKCRAEYAYVASITDKEGNKFDSGESIYASKFKYICGEIVRPNSYDDDIRVECSHGIHFFLTRQEAEDYSS